MPTIIENINNIISTKSELKTILTENGLEPSENFNEYPDMFRSIVGGGSIDEAALNGYISSYLDTYSFIDQTALSANSYLTEHQDLSAYATKSYVVDYVASYAGGGNAAIDENIIPKSNYTYTLGTSSYIYKTAYVTDLYTSVHNKISNRGDNQMNIQLNNAWRYVFHTNNFSPASDNTINLGASDAKWKAAYSYSLYATVGYLGTSPIATEDYVATYVATYGGGGSATINENIIPKENNAYTLGDASNMYNTTYTYITYLGSSKIYHNTDNSIYIDYKNGKRLLIGPSTIYGSAGLSIGASSFPFTNTYTTYLYLNGTNIKDSINGMFSYDSTTGILTITSLT